MSYIKRHRLALFLLAVLGVTGVDFGAFQTLERSDLGSTTRIAVALTPLPADLVLIALVLGRIRRLDEFRQRVHFEAVAVAFLSTGVAVFVYGYLQKAHAVGPLNTPLVWGFMLFFYAVGYFIAMSHYR